MMQITFGALNHQILIATMSIYIYILLLHHQKITQLLASATFSSWFLLLLPEKENIKVGTTCHGTKGHHVAMSE